jgi:hypothetical protein
MKNSKRYSKLNTKYGTDMLSKEGYKLTDRNKVIIGFAGTGRRDLQRSIMEYVMSRTPRERLIMNVALSAGKENWSDEKIESMAETINMLYPEERKDI